MRRSALAVLLVLGTLAACGGDDEPTTAVERRPAAGGIDVSDPPRTFRITYEVEHLNGEETTRRETEVVEVRLPLDLRIERTEDDDEELDELQIATLGVLELGAPDQGRASLVADPGVPEGAPVLSGDLGVLLDEGIVEDLEEATTVLDRECRFLRVAVDAEDDDRATDVCVDERSIVLHEEELRDGEVLTRRHAVELEVDVRFEDDAFQPIGERLAESLGGGRVRRMTATSRFPDVDFWELDEVPDGYRHLGRYVIATESPIDAQGMPGARTVSLADVLVGPDGALLVVENVRSTSVGVPGLPADVGVPWEVDGFDGVRLVAGLRQSELRTEHVRVVGTGPVDALVEVFESLVLRTGPATTEAYDDVEDVVDYDPDERA